MVATEEVYWKTLPNWQQMIYFQKKQLWAKTQSALMPWKMVSCQANDGCLQGLKIVESVQMLILNLFGRDGFNLNNYE